MKYDVLHFSRQVVLATTLALIVSSSSAQEATLTVRVDQPGALINPLFYGIAYEEINRAGDGGLYAEMLQNRSFEDAAVPSGWLLLQNAGAEGTMTLDKSRPLNPNNPTSLRLEITKAGGGRVGVANNGFRGPPFSLYPPAAGAAGDGLAVERGRKYRLSLYAQCASGFSGPLTASLEKQDGTSIALQAITGLSSVWQRFECRFTARNGDTNARLVIAAASPGTVWLDMVSLFPEKTFNDRANGCRPDLAQVTADLKPAFLRFPGGLFVEGDVMTNAFRWKNTIGDIAQRPGHWNPWGYPSTDGLGFHEYLQLSEDLGAEPIFCINAGMAYREYVPLDQMSQWVQDALDAIEYANGPTDTLWGSQRAQNGHPAPFNLKYLEIGNENRGPIYQERYALFYDAIKARYPAIILIANVPTDFRPADVVDEHYYGTPEYLITQARLFDGYPRDGARIFVGEYAANEDSGQGNLRGAIAEAAFLTGLERNADLVMMASYAPLFANVSHKIWNPALINFDNSRLYVIPGYHVQKMFADNRGDRLLPIQVSAPPLQDGSPSSDGADTPILDSLYASASVVTRSARPDQAPQDVILKVVNVSNRALETTIQLEGAEKVNGPVQAIVLTSPNPADENSFDQPAKVVPVTATIPQLGASLRHSFPANSLTVLRFKVKCAAFAETPD